MGGVLITMIKQNYYRQGIMVEVFSLGWMILEFVVGCWSGWRACSLLLVAFGLDSLFEIISGGALFWRLNVTSRRSPSEVARVERRAGRIVSWCLLALAVYIGVTSGYNLVNHQGAESSLVGMLMALASLICMPLLMMVKLRVARKINSSALREDAMCNLTCAYTAAAVLVGNVLTAWQGWWWSDSVFSLLLIIFIVKEGLEGVRD